MRYAGPECIVACGNALLGVRCAPWTAPPTTTTAFLSIASSGVRPAQGRA
jgi:hypothetical protein